MFGHKYWSERPIGMAHPVIEYRLLQARVGQANRKAEKYGCTGRLTVQDWLNVYASFKSTCSICGSRDYPGLDHIIRMADGGANSKENLWLLCRSCHHEKCRWENAGPARRLRLPWQAYIDAQKGL
jgi:5-methylcytosine-specific restriction endonuclease McrA